MLEYDFSKIKGWTEEQIKNGEYHDYSDTVIRKDGRKRERRFKKLPGGQQIYTYWVWNRCYGSFPREGKQIHHKDGDTLNDNIENLAVLGKSDHIRLHVEQLKGVNLEERYGQEKADRLKNLISEKTKEGMLKVVHPNLGKRLPEETKKKISESLKGKLAGENNHFYGEDHSGENNPFYGKKHTEEAKRKISIANKNNSAWNKGKELSEQVRLNMSKNHADFSGDKNPFAGKTHSEETRKRLAEVNTKHQVWDVWIDNKGILKYKDANGKNRRVPLTKIPAEIKKKVEALYNK